MTGAVVTALGSIVGTGAFVAIGLASAEWGDAVLWAIPLAAVVAVFNGLSSAFLAGRFPVAGGTYEYGYQTLGPWWGFSAGWLFILAKTASAATAALGVALYLGTDSAIVPIATVLVVTVLVLTGVRRTALANAVLVAITSAAILWFAWSGLTEGTMLTQDPPVAPSSGALLAAVAFLFVAYTGYGRIATLGEEVKDPARIIPRAVVVTLAVAATLYMAIALGGRAWAGETWGAVLNLTRFIDSGFVRFGFSRMRTSSASTVSSSSAQVPVDWTMNLKGWPKSRWPSGGGITGNASTPGMFMNTGNSACAIC